MKTRNLVHLNVTLLNVTVGISAGGLNIENSDEKQRMTVIALISEQGKAKENHEYSSTIFSRYLSRDLHERGTLMSTLSLLNSCVAFTRFPGVCL